jgi:hypothetical protein
VSSSAPSALPRLSRAWRWSLGVGLGVVAALSLVLLFMLAQATGNRELYERYYNILFVLNVAVAGLLLAIIAWAVVRMGLRLKRGKFGSRLLVKLAAIFALVMCGWKALWGRACSSVGSRSIVWPPIWATAAAWLPHRSRSLPRVAAAWRSSACASSSVRAT